MFSLSLILKWVINALKRPIKAKETPFYMFISSISICTNSYKRANFFPNFYIWFDSLYPIHNLYWLLNSYLNILNLRKVKYWKCSIYILLKKTIAKIRIWVRFTLILQGCKRKSSASFRVNVKSACLQYIYNQSWNII